MGTGANNCSGTHDGIRRRGSHGNRRRQSAPFAGSFRPESPLSAFNGKSVNGTWKLRVTDTAALDVGTIGCVQLEITRQRFVCCGVAGTPEITAGPATLVNESCPPDNNAIDPGESVTVNLSLTNIGDGRNQQSRSYSANRRRRDFTRTSTELWSPDSVTGARRNRNQRLLVYGGRIMRRHYYRNLAASRRGHQSRHCYQDVRAW